MNQEWLSVIGLLLDLIGVLLLAFEWWRAFEGERRGLSARLFQLSLRVVPSDEFDPVKEQLRDIRHERLALAPRRRYVGLGLCLIVVGFLLQLLGAWPGGIPAIGLAP